MSTIFLGSSGSGTAVTSLSPDSTYTISYPINQTTYPHGSYPNQWFILSANNNITSGQAVNICGGGGYVGANYIYTGGNATYNAGVMYTTFYLPPVGTTINDPYGSPFTINIGTYYLIPTIADAAYSGTFGTPVIYEVPISGSIVCFKEDTKILTISGYVLIQDLKPRQLVKTLHRGYVPVNMIGTTTIDNSNNNVKNCLYKCSKDAYPELFEDLYITGGHSILVDEFKDDQQQEVINMLGAVFVTEGKFRLPACIDKRASLYKDKKPVKIYHIALDNNYSNKNYGIYANGLLVESCDKITLKDLSNMTIISG